MAAKRGRTITSFGQLFGSISGGSQQIIVPVAVATGEVEGPQSEGAVRGSKEVGVATGPQSQGTVKNEG